jgi:type II restriction enzyme
VKLGFEESSQDAYDSGSQKARVLTETWASAQAFCPNCGHDHLSKFPSNMPVADFFCPSCGEQYELKSQKTRFGNKIADGAFRTMCERLESQTNPNLILLNYLPSQGVRNLFVVPKYFFVQNIIEVRPPLAPTARRAGWVGCNILLHLVPDAGKIHIVRDGQIVEKAQVLAAWQRTTFLREEGDASRGWLLNVLKCVEEIGRTEFDLTEVYAFESRLSKLYPSNQHVRQKIRQQLQVLRDRGYISFEGRGRYHLTP